MDLSVKKIYAAFFANTLIFHVLVIFDRSSVNLPQSMVIDWHMSLR